MHEADFYFDILYPLQDRVISGIGDLRTGFYLAGGTAASTVPRTCWPTNSQR
ncbi:hypothetical protein L6Q96_21025 [Candidatus Binatia bacterium]|nr:hypothetical protein [Candidatus Binatia bacterium]